MLWLKSRNSEVWLERRTGYTRSTAVMSMVGYLLGLGDRHPSNLMLDRYSGKLLHIDFGDCFEVCHKSHCSLSVCLTQCCIIPLASPLHTHPSSGVRYASRSQRTACHPSSCL